MRPRAPGRRQLGRPRPPAPAGRRSASRPAQLGPRGSGRVGGAARRAARALPHERQGALPHDARHVRLQGTQRRPPAPSGLPKKIGKSASTARASRKNFRKMKEYSVLSLLPKYKYARILRMKPPSLK